MIPRTAVRFTELVAVAILSANVAFGQEPSAPTSERPSPTVPEGPPGAFGGPGGGFPGRGQERKVLERFDANGDGRLNLDERLDARNAMKMEGPTEDRGGGRRGSGGMRPPGMGDEAPAGPGPKVSPSDVNTYPDAPLYDTSILRSIFLQFESDDWEAELSDFHNTDVDVPCTLTVDGRKYSNVGARFRGASSYMMVAPAENAHSISRWTWWTASSVCTASRPSTCSMRMAIRP